MKQNTSTNKQPSWAAQRTKRERIIITLLAVPIGLFLILAVVVNSFDYYFNSSVLTGTVQNSKLSNTGRRAGRHYQTDVVFTTTLKNGENGTQVNTNRLYVPGETIEVHISDRTGAVAEAPDSRMSIMSGALGAVALILVVKLWSTKAV